MKSDNNDKNEIITISKINSHNKHNKPISTITSSTAHFITEEIQNNGPNSDSYFISVEDKNENKNTRKIKQKMEFIEPNFILLKNKDNKNNEIYDYLMKKEDLNYIKELNELYDYNQIFNFVLNRLNPNNFLKCNIFLDNSNNSFILYSYTQKFILSAKQDFSLLHNNYIIYISRNFLSETSIAKLHSYSKKTEFILYDMGFSPKLLLKNKIISDKIRKYLLQVNYLYSKNFQNFIAYLPKKDYFDNDFYNNDEKHNDKLSNKKLDEVDKFENSKPKYDISLKKFIDNYDSRIKEKSKYNFKIIYGNDKKAIECGKINENNYVLDIGYPFSPLEGFAIALANFIKNK